MKKENAIYLFNWLTFSGMCAIREDRVRTSCHSYATYAAPPPPFHNHESCSSPIAPLLLSPIVLMQKSRVSITTLRQTTVPFLFSRSDETSQCGPERQRTCSSLSRLRSDQLSLEGESPCCSSASVDFPFRSPACTFGA